MQNAILLLFPLVVFAGLTPNTTTYTRPDIIETQTIDIPTYLVNTPQIAEFKATEPVSPIECSCVKYAQSLVPEIPLWNAIDYPVNTINPKIGDIIKLQYYNATTTKYTYHITVIEKITEDSYLVKEANFEKCKSGERTIKKTDDNIVGFFSVDLWREILKLPQDLQDTLKCESNFSHYKHGAVIRGDADEIGIAQFKKETWKWMTDLRRKNNEKEILLDIWNPYDQLKQMKYMWDLNYQDHWSCYKSPESVVSE